MYCLNIRSVNWIIIKNIGCLLCCVLLFACSNTQTFNTKNAYVDISENDYMKKQFYNTYASKINAPTNQYTQYTDHQLMMSLLNRPVTADHAMMIAFEQERMAYTASFSSSSSYGIEIKGNKNDENINYRANNLYSELILQDINAVNMSAPH